jgi:hypothetical protein
VETEEKFRDSPVAGAITGGGGGRRRGRCRGSRAGRRRRRWGAGGGGGGAQAPQRRGGHGESAGLRAHRRLRRKCVGGNEKGVADETCLPRPDLPTGRRSSRSCARRVSGSATTTNADLTDPNGNCSPLVAHGAQCMLSLLTGPEKERGPFLYARFQTPQCDNCTCGERFKIQHSFNFFFDKKGRPQVQVQS